MNVLGIHLILVVVTSCNIVTSEAMGLCAFDNLVTSLTETEQTKPSSESGCFVSSEVDFLQENEVYINKYCTERCICTCTGELKCDTGYRCDGNATCDVREEKHQCYCNDGFTGDGVNCIIPIDCNQILLAGNTHDGVYTIYPLNWNGLPFKVYCNMTIDGGGWTVFQRRVNGSVDFYRGWEEYKRGFGGLDHEFWLGNDKLFYLTNQKDYELRIDIVSEYLDPYYAQYTLFRLSNETMEYQITVLGNFSGTAGFDGMHYHRNRSFSTYDHDRDSSSRFNCAFLFHAAWWFGACADSNLNGEYHATPYEYSSIRFDPRHGNAYNIKYVEMKLRSPYENN